MANPWIIDPADPASEKQINLTVTGADGVERPLWLKVRSELSEGQRRKMLKMVSSVSQPVARPGQDAGAGQEATATFEWTDYSFARMVAYIIDWSLAHEPDKAMRLPPTRASYEALRSENFDAIDKALDEHEAAINEGKARTDSERRRSRISA